MNELLKKNFGVRQEFKKEPSIRYRAFSQRSQFLEYESKQRIQVYFKHGGGSIMVWECFTASGVGAVVKIEGIMNSGMFRDIHKNN